MQDPAAPIRIVGRRPQLTRVARVVLAVTAVIWCALLVWDVYRQRWSGPVLVGVWLAAVLALRLRPPAVVDASGVRLPWRRRGHLSWTEVDTVAQTLPGYSFVQLNMVDGSTVSLDGIPIAQAAAVAALGGKRVAPPEPRRRSAVSPPPPARRPTDQDIEADVARRAQALAEERAAWERRSAPRPGER